MAARTGASVGVAVAITVLAVFSFTFFVLAVVFFGQAQNAKAKAADAERAIEQTIAEVERNDPAIQDFDQAARAERMTLVGYLVKERRELLRAVTGEPDLTMDQFAARVEPFREGATSESGTVLDLLRDRDRAIAEKDASIDQTTRDYEAALARADAEAARADALAADFDTAGESLRGDVSAYTTGVDELRRRYGSIEDRMATENERLRSLVSQIRDDTNSTIGQLQNDVLVLQNQLAICRGEQGGNTIQPKAEEALVDGRIDAVDPASGEVIVSIGRDQKAVIGMTFAIYSTGADIRVEPGTGEYAGAKGVIEITRVEKTFSRARVIRESRGDAIVRGDVIANAVYDPNKVYKFVIYGSFDRNGDGIATELERDDVASLIRQWGGEVVDTLEGDVDFLVLGQKPEIGPPPPPGAPAEILDEYVRRQRQVARYDDLLGRAQDRSLSVLNENRLRTLIGEYPD